MFACEEYREKIQTFVEGGLSQSESRELSSHFSLCPSCRSDLEISRKLFGILDFMEEVEPPSSLVTDIMTSIEHLKPAPVGERGINIFKIMVFISGIISIPFIIWLITNTNIGFTHNFRSQNVLQDSFIIRLFITIAKSITSLFNDLPITSLASYTLSNIRPFHFLTMFAGIILASSILFSFLVIFLSVRHRLHQEN